MSFHTRLRGRLPAAAAIAAGAATLAPAAASAGSTYEKVSVKSRTQHILYGRHASVKGQIKPKQRGRTVWIQIRKPGQGWRIVARPKTGGEGRFKASWRPKSITRYKVRAFLTGSDATPKQAPGGVTVYRTAHASWYGPGFYGNTTACGQTYSSSIQGVAHKTLPCGTRVSLYYRGRATTVPVIDRGPYVGDREYDLSAATARRLGFSGTDTIWAAPN